MKIHPTLRAHLAIGLSSTAVPLTLILTQVLWSSMPGFGQSPPVRQAPVSFVEDVAPILKENCFACHDAKKRKGKFDMSTFREPPERGSGRSSHRRGEAG